MDTLTPMAELAARWGITANTVSRRLSFLGIKAERQGNLRYITAEQLAQGDALQDHIVSGKPMELFPRADQPDGGLVTRRVSGSGLVTGQVEQMAAMAPRVRVKNRLGWISPQPICSPDLSESLRCVTCA